MSRVAGIDLRENCVRLVVVRALYRKLDIEFMLEVSLADHETPADALRAVLAAVPEGPPDSVAVTIAGNKTFVHRLALPPAAEKKLAELLPFELEAELPIEIDDLVFDFVKLPVVAKEGATVDVITLAARREHVRQRIEFFKNASGIEPERVGSSALDLAQLCRVTTELRSEHPVALVDLGHDRTDVCIVVSGRPQASRTLSLGIGRFPDGAEACAAQIRQTIASFEATTDLSVGRAVVLGDGALLSGLNPFLRDRLHIEVSSLPVPQLEGVPTGLLPKYPAFGRALASALHGARGGGFDLRQGELAYQQGYDAIKERAPLLAGLAGAVFISFLFATWAEGRALERENEALAESLQAITQSTFGEGTPDPDEAEALLIRARKNRPEDPMGYLDGFGVAVALSETIPEDITHDIEQLDFGKGSLKLRGLVDSTDAAQRVAKAVGEHRCIEDPKITKITQVVGDSDKERYVLEANVRCPEDQSDKKSQSQGDDE